MAKRWSVALLAVVSACGSSPSAEPSPDELVTSVDDDGAQSVDDEVRSVADWDDDRDPRWEIIGLRSSLELSLADDTAAVAAVAWTEQFGSSTIDLVEATGACAKDCLLAVEAWALDQLAVGPLPTVAEEDLCGECAEAGRLSFISVAADGRFEPMQRDEVQAVLGEIDTTYEVMVLFGKPARVRPDGGGWRAVLHRVVSDCDPYIDEYTIWSVDRAGETEQLAQFEERSSSCA